MNLRLKFKGYSTAIQWLTKEPHDLILLLLLSDCSTAAQQSINPNNDLQILLDEYSAAIKLISNTDSFQILLDEYSKVENLHRASAIATIEEIQEFINTIQPVLLSLWNLQLKENKQIQDFQIMIQQLLEKCSAVLLEANSID